MSHADAISGLTEGLMELDIVDSTRFQSENHYDTTPNILHITPQYGTDEETIEQLAIVTTKILEPIISNEIKTSIEYSRRPVTNDEGELIGSEPIKHLPYISIRWNRRWMTTPQAVRYDGWSVDTEEYDPIESVDQGVKLLLAVDGAADGETPEPNIAAIAE